MIYKLRIYTVKPDCLDELLHLWENEGKPIIDKYMDCIGIWVTESGTLNQVVHLYAWENYEHREQARMKFYAQPESKVYVAKVKKLYQSQESRIMKPASFSPRTVKEV